MTTSLRHLSHKVVGKLGFADALLAPDRGAPIILMYHGVAGAGSGEDEGDHKHVNEALFRQHIALLAQRRRVVPLTRLVGDLLAGRDCSGQVAITFDDGYLNNVEVAAPVLKEHGLCGTFFLATGFIGAGRWAWTDRLEFVVASAANQEIELPFELAPGAGRIRVRFGPPEERTVLLRKIKASLKHLHWREAQERVAALGAAAGVANAPPHGQYRFMSWDQARQLVADGFEVGAHTVNHAILSRVPLAEAEEEILGSQTRIRDEVGTCSGVFCYPNGKLTDFNEGVMAICHGRFDAALSAESGSARAADRFQIRRIGVGNETSVKYLAARVLKGE